MLNLCKAESRAPVASLLAVALLWLVGCGDRTNQTAAGNSETSHQTETVTLHLPGMNESLQILWGDWPNKVKQALAELDGVESVEDEWERELESDEDLDLLFVKYDPSKVTIEQMKATIKQHQFEATVTEEPK